MLQYRIIRLIVLSIVLIELVRGQGYPSKSLQCYSTLTKPDKRLICPASRYVVNMD